MRAGYITIEGLFEYLHFRSSFLVITVLFHAYLDIDNSMCYRILNEGDTGIRRVLELSQFWEDRRLHCVQGSVGIEYVLDIFGWRNKLRLRLSHSLMRFKYDRSVSVLELIEYDGDCMKILQGISKRERVCEKRIVTCKTLLQFYEILNMPFITFPSLFPNTRNTQSISVTAAEAADFFLSMNDLHKAPFVEQITRFLLTLFTSPSNNSRPNTNSSNFKDICKQIKLEIYRFTTTPLHQ